MSENSKKIEPLSLEQKRLKAIEYAFWAGKLLEPEYFNKASEAIAKKDKDAFFKVAKDAGIPEEVLKQFSDDSKSLTLNQPGGWGGWGGWGGGW